MEEPNEKITALVDSIHADLDLIEVAGEHSTLIKKAAGAMERLDAMLITMATATGITPVYNDLAAQAKGLRAMLPVKSEDMTRRLGLVAKALDAADILPGIPVDAIHEVMDRADAIFTAKTTSKQDSTRGIGETIVVECACGGFVRESKSGDWTNIRYQAKVHASECTTANPYGQFVNDLDAARKSIVERRSDYHSGGLTFTLPESAAVVLPAE